MYQRFGQVQNCHLHLIFRGHAQLVKINKKYRQNCKIAKRLLMQFKLLLFDYFQYLKNTYVGLISSLAIFVSKFSFL